MEVATIGLDPARHVFQVHGADASGGAVPKRRLRRREVSALFAALKPCPVGVEACATARFWARGPRALGHEARPMPARYVEACLRRGENDAADAAAIREAVARPSTRFVPVKGEAQQAALMPHRVRDPPVRRRARSTNAIRGRLAESGVIEAQGPWDVGRPVAGSGQDGAVPEMVRDLVEPPAAQLEEAERRIDEVDARVLAWHKADTVSRRLAAIPGIGPPVATATAAAVPDPSAFRSGREFAAWLGPVPRQNSTGGKTRPGRTGRRGDAYVRRPLVIGAPSVLYRSRAARANPWIRGLPAKRPRTVVAVALADRTARTAWAVMARGTTCRIAAAAQVRPPTGCLRGRRSGMEWSVAPTGRGKPGEVEGLEPEDLLGTRPADPIGACGHRRPRRRPDT